MHLDTGKSEPEHPNPNLVGQHLIREDNPLNTTFSGPNLNAGVSVGPSFNFGVIKITLTNVLQHTRIIYCPKTLEAVVVDPASQAGLILDQARKAGLRISQVWLTHSHPDHCGGVAGILKGTGAKLFAHPHLFEAYLRFALVLSCKQSGLDTSAVERCPQPDVKLRGGEQLIVGSLNFEVIHSPGHSPGHLCFYNRESKALLAGDTILNNSMATTRIIGANRNVFRKTLQKLATLPDDTHLLAGHLDDTVLSAEKAKNPYLRRYLGL